jgi:hypothetical protein
MNNDLIRRSDLKAAVDDICYSWGEETEVEGFVLIALVDELPAVDAEVVRHGGNTTFVTTDNLDAYTDRIIVIQGSWCKVYYRDSDDEEEG